MRRVSSIVLITALVIALYLLGMFWSFKAGGFVITTDCKMHKSFYHHGKVYSCIPMDILLKFKDNKRHPTKPKVQTF